MNNTEKTFKNSIIAVISQVIALLLQFVNRKIFIIFLSIEYLGYQTLFSNIFTLLSVAELGIGNIITFHLYKEIVQDNKREIGKLMYLYKWLYRLVAGIVCILGIICSIFIPFMVKDATASLNYLRIVYFMQLMSVVFGYFLSYKRVIYIATQQEYKCVQIDLYVNIVLQCVQLLLLAIFRNYLLYLFIQLSITIVANIIIAIKSNKDFPYLKNKFTITKEDIEKRNLITDTGNFLVHQISYAIYGGTDNIIISAFCGVRYVALYGNYILVQKGVMQVLFYKLLNPIQATIGNIIYADRSKEELWKQFKLLDVFSFIFASFIGLGFFTFYQPFIQIWMGKKYLLDFSFVIIFSIYIYFGAVFEIVYKYRCVFGDYKQDRLFMVASAVLNILISIPGAIYYGVSGVIFGTVAAYIPIALGRIRFVVKNYFGQSMTHFILHHMALFIVVVVEAGVIYLFTCRLQVNVIGFILRILAWLIIPSIGSIIVFRRNEYFIRLLGIGKRMIQNILNKILKREEK